MATLHEGGSVQGDVLRNISTRRPELVQRLILDRAEGAPWWNLSIAKKDGTRQIMSMRNFCDFTHSMIGVKRMQNIEDCLDVVRNEAVKGDLLEAGVWRGGAAIFMRGYLAAYEMRERVVWAADSFEGLPAPSHSADAGFDFSAATVPILAVSLDEVRANFARYGLLDDRVRFLKGWFRDTLHDSNIGQLALLRVDGDLYESTRDTLSALYDRVSEGGFVLVDDYGDFAPCRQAVDEFRQQRQITSPIVKVDWSGVYWRK